ncbi:MAG: polysaccharide deacetylase family protein [Bdellovibrionota bacterium]
MKYKIEYPHGIMFHHFYDEHHPVGQGSISVQEFENIIKFIGPENILSAADWMNYCRENATDKIKNKVCITFDDSLKCQYDIALPVLNKYKIKAFFFVYSSVLRGQFEFLEVSRYYRSKFYRDFDHFFSSFMRKVQNSEFAQLAHNKLKDFQVGGYLKEFSFYTDNDKIYRYTRDNILTDGKYDQIITAMMKESQIDLDSLRDKLWMTLDNVRQLSLDGHLIGLHSDTHPMTLGLQSYGVQREEYLTNKNFLESKLEIKVKSMSHPCNSYNVETLKLLEELNIELGFRSNMERGFNSKFEWPREDHINLLKQYLSSVQ